MRPSRKLICLSLMAFGILANISMAFASDGAWFKAYNPDGSPLKHAPIYVFNGDIYAQQPIAELYPYDGVLAKSSPTYLGQTITDESGQFSITVQDYAQQSLILKLGSVTYPIRLEKTSDLARTPSADHIRVIEWDDGSGKVQNNKIYNWRTQNVVIFSNATKEESPAPHIILNTAYLNRLAAPTRPLTASDEAHLLRQLQNGAFQPKLLDDARRAITAKPKMLRELAAKYMGEHGTHICVPYLIDAIGDEEIKETAADTLTQLTGETFGTDSAKWKDWLNERNLIIEKIRAYQKDTNHEDIDIYRVHLNADKTKWGASFVFKNYQPGAPALSIDRQTGEIQFIQGR